MILQPEQLHVFGLFTVTADCGQFGKVQTHSVPQCAAAAVADKPTFTSWFKGQTEESMKERGLSAELCVNQRCVVIVFLLTVVFAEHAKLLNLLETL